MPLVHLKTAAPAGAQSFTARTVGILPVAATEAHGPHLPLSTDCDIAEGHLRALPAYLGPGIEAVVLPLQRVGFSLEHARFAGTESRDAGTLIAEWFALIETFAAAGGRRLVIVSSHGGNTPVVDTLILKARAAFPMLAVGTAWLRFGCPEGLFAEPERRYGIHGGDIETSLMLHYAPQKVDLDRAEDFSSRLTEWDRRAERLSAHGPHRFGWLSSDLNAKGVVGNAAAASAAKGAALADHILTGFAALLDEVAAFDLGRFD